MSLRRIQQEKRQVFYLLSCDHKIVEKKNKVESR
jgi:hypothetical protein